MAVNPESPPARQLPDLPSLCLAVTEHAPLPMATVEGPTHVVRYANPAFCRLMGKPIEELVGKVFGELLPEKDVCLTLIKRVFQTRNPESYTEEESSRSHPIFWSYTIWPLLSAEGLLGVMIQVTETAKVHEKTVAMNEALVLGSLRQHELTEAAENLNQQLRTEMAERRQAEDALRQSHAELRESEERYRTSFDLGKQMEEALREGDRRKDQFLATLAHELRNPLAPIRSGLEIIRRPDSDPAMIEQTLNIVERQTNQIVRLVDDLLDVSRITQGKINLQIERVELRDVINMALETNRPLLEAAKHKLIVSLPAEPIYLEADAMRLAQIFINLLNNAVKYTEPNGTIALTVATINNQAEIRLKDNGVGISADMLPHIFDIFMQVERISNAMHGGLGIGLSLARKLAEMHGGTIEATSAGEGSEFIVRLPLAADQTTLEKPLAPIAEPVPENVKRRILVVDDNVDAAEMMHYILGLEGHEVSLAYTGEAAVRMAIESSPDVVLLDIGLPDIDGYEVARKIRVKLPQVLLVALTGWGEEAARSRSREAGFDSHVVKPVVGEKLKELLAGIAAPRPL